MKYRLLVIIGLIILVLCFGIVLFTGNHKSNLNIYFFEAGKADSCIIYNDDFAVLIDTGEKDLGNEILVYLENHNIIKKLDYLIITHFDKDHVGGSSSVLKGIQVDNVIQSNYPKESKVYNKYLNALSEKNITPVTLREDMSFNFGDVYFNINAPIEEVYSNNESNNSSLIVSVKYKNNSFLFMGDAENLRIKEYVLNNSDTYDFIKIPYHGHYQTSLDELLDVVKPKYAVITSSNEELEDKTTLELLNSNNCNYYLTRKGSVLITSNGNKINIKQ